MSDRRRMGVVEVQSVRERPVHERGVGGRRRARRPDDRARAAVGRDRHHGRGEVVRRRRESQTQHIEGAETDAGEHVGGKMIELEGGRKGGQALGEGHLATPGAPRCRFSRGFESP
jgi:hypothetical protein